MAVLPNVFGTPLAHQLVPHTAEGRCQAALLAVTAALSFLLPLVLLAPLAGKRRGRQASNVTVIGRLESGLSYALGLLLCRSPQQGDEPRGQAAVAAAVPAVPLVLRWAALLSVLWAAACALYD